ncbi:MAG: glucokinase [Prochlorotrichaceae cyanobacterium]|jgi:glucokinase
MVQFLAGDIGGTKTILRLFDGDQTIATGILAEAEYSSPAYPDLVPLVQQFLQDYAAITPDPQAACFALAGPVVGETCQLTNLSWHLSSDRLAQALGLQKVALINDFVAVGFGVLGLEPQDLFYLQSVPADPTAPIGVLGAGTGLGECFLAPLGNGTYQAYATEGGHTDFAPRSPLEFDLYQFILNRASTNRVSVERVVSGQGIVTIYQFLRETGKYTESEAIGSQIRAWERGERPDLMPGGLIAGSVEEDALCRDTVQLFMDAYAVEAGNLALKLLPYGGLYLAGGIAAKNLSWFQNDRFLQILKAKGRVSGVLDQIPIAVVLNPKVGLIGAALHIKAIFDGN